MKDFLTRNICRRPKPFNLPNKNQTISITLTPRNERCINEKKLKSLVIIKKKVATKCRILLAEDMKKIGMC